MNLIENKQKLDQLYSRYNRRDYVHPDPLEFLHLYPDAADREVVGLVASSLAYGRVAQILESVERVLTRMGPSPAQFVERSSLVKLIGTFDGFRHRFTSGEEIAALLFAAGIVRMHHGSLEECFRAGLNGSRDVVAPLSAFVAELGDAAGGPIRQLLPSPEDGSACKRLNLFLRWMVRHDAVDPGGWTALPASMLIIPLDTHMHRIALALGLTQRRQADLRTAVEITAAFRTIAPDDPVRYDFALTRLGMRGGDGLANFLNELEHEEAHAHA